MQGIKEYYISELEKLRNETELGTIRNERGKIIISEIRLTWKEHESK